MTGQAVAGGNVRLRELTEAHLQLFSSSSSIPTRFGWTHFHRATATRSTRIGNGVIADDTVIVKTILFDGNVAGNIASWEQSGERLVGYWIGREYWGRGIATRALARFLEAVGARPITARVAKHNVAPIRVLEKCGFVGRGAQGPRRRRRGVRDDDRGGSSSLKQLGRIAAVGGGTSPD
jgi:RimJ/RimL family protein N-acetyltransferase